LCPFGQKKGSEIGISETPGDGRERDSPAVRKNALFPVRGPERGVKELGEGKHRDGDVSKLILLRQLTLPFSPDRHKTSREKRGEKDVERESSGSTSPRGAPFA